MLTSWQRGVSIGSLKLSKNGSKVVSGYISYLLAKNIFIIDAFWAQVTISKTKREITREQMLSDPVRLKYAGIREEFGNVERCGKTIPTQVFKFFKNFCHFRTLSIYP